MASTSRYKKIWFLEVHLPKYNPRLIRINGIPSIPRAKWNKSNGPQNSWAWHQNFHILNTAPPWKSKLELFLRYCRFCPTNSVTHSTCPICLLATSHVKVFHRDTQDFSSFSLLYLSSSFKKTAFGFMTLGRSPRHLGQYHFPLGFVVRDTHPKWNHSMGQRSLSQRIISPKEIWSQRQ